MSLQPYSCATSCRCQLVFELKIDQSAPTGQHGQAQTLEGAMYNIVEQTGSKPILCYTAVPLPVAASWT